MTIESKDFTAKSYDSVKDATWEMVVDSIRNSELNATGFECNSFMNKRVEPDSYAVVISFSVNRPRVEAQDLAVEFMQDVIKLYNEYQERFAPDHVN